MRKLATRALMLFSLLILLLPLCAGASAEDAAAGDSLVKDGGFDEAGAWRQDMWNWDEGVSVLSIESVDGNDAAHVVNLGENDARFEQTLAVEPDTLYRISGRIRAAGISEEADGATLSIKNTFVHTESVYETEGGWQDVELYGRTGPDQDEIVLMARLGGYGSLNAGEAWFDDISVEKAEDEPEQAQIFSLATVPPSGAQQDDGSEEEDSPARGAWQALTIALFYLAACAAVFLAMRRERTAPVGGIGPEGLFALLLAAAFVLRAVLSVLWRGYGVDMSCFIGWSARIAETLPSGFYAADAFCDYPPGYMYVLWLVGALLKGLGIAFDSPIGYLLIKFVPILLDLALALLIWYAAKPIIGNMPAAALGALFAFNPASIINSAVWGQIDAVLTFLLVLAMLEAAKGKWHFALPAYGAAVLVKPQALVFGPLALLILIVEIAESREKRRLLLHLLLSVLLMLAVMIALCLPFLVRMDPQLLPESVTLPGGWRFYPDGWFKPVCWLLNLYGNTLSSYPYFSINACNVFALLGLNWTELAMFPALRTAAQALMVLSYLYAGFLYIRGRDRGKMFLSAAVVLTLFFAFGLKMHERYLYPALAMLLVAYVFDHDVRLLIAFALLSFTQFLNTALVFQNEHLISALRGFNAAVSLANLLAAALLCWTGWGLCVERKTIPLKPPQKPQFAWERKEPRRSTAIPDGLFHPRDWHVNLRRREAVLMAVLTAVYAAVAFVNLGVTDAPESNWVSSAAGEQLTFDLGQVRDFRMTYYGGICSSTFMVQFSEDGEVWTESHYAEYDQGQIFRWLQYTPSERDEDGEFYPVGKTDDGRVQARFVRLTMESAGMVLSEVGFLGGDGKPLPVSSVHITGGNPEYRSDPALLIDEQNTVPAVPSYLNSTYFDEIYHARTAYEFLHGMHAYEYTHPPLGKVLIMFGIQLFGMTPFGWRFAGTLFGVLMVPLMYLLAKQLTKRKSLAFLCAFLLSVDSMHFTQTRIATIDTFPVFFIMLMYLFMIRYCQMSFYHQKLGKTLVPLMLSGISMGFAIASKWIGFYGAAGLAVLFFHSLYLRWREAVYARRGMDGFDADQRRIAQRAVKLFTGNTVATLLWCVLFFVIVPALIYYFSYFWQMRPEGGLSVSRVWNMQVSMYDYHKSISWQTHAFESHWYEWPFIVKPMWYYSGTQFQNEGMVSSISCMGNPAVWWVGIVALVWVLIRYFTTSARDNRRYLYVLIGFMAEYLPWVLVPRSTYIYHYFASVPFIILATALLLDWVRKRSFRGYKAASVALCAAALILFIAFYPLESGLPAPRGYVRYLRWFHWINY